jgi:hypothetical protein
MGNESMDIFWGGSAMLYVVAGRWCPGGLQQVLAGLGGGQLRTSLYLKVWFLWPSHLAAYICKDRYGAPPRWAPRELLPPQP